MIPIKQIEAFFKENPPGDRPIRLTPAERCLNPAKTIETALNVLKHNAGNPIFNPYYVRLLKIYEYYGKEIH
jgi:hypothetical protein